MLTQKRLCKRRSFPYFLSWEICGLIFRYGNKIKYFYNEAELSLNVL